MQRSIKFAADVLADAVDTFDVVILSWIEGKFVPLLGAQPLPLPPALLAKFCDSDDVVLETCREPDERRPLVQPVAEGDELVKMISLLLKLITYQQNCLESSGSP